MHYLNYFSIVQPFDCFMHLTKNNIAMSAALKEKDLSIPAQIGENISKWRKLKSIKQKDLAKKINVSVSSLSNYENNKTAISHWQMHRIANALQVSITELIEDPMQVFTKIKRKSK